LNCAVPDLLLRSADPDDLADVRALCAAVLDHDYEPGEIADLLIAGGRGTAEWRSSRALPRWSV
jgi:hypothetical protein